jgi:hypothetical protein
MFSVEILAMQRTFILERSGGFVKHGLHARVTCFGHRLRLDGATEIVFAPGQGDSLVEVNRESDFPAEASQISRVTRSNIPDGILGAEIDQAVSRSSPTAISHSHQRTLASRDAARAA